MQLIVQLTVQITEQHHSFSTYPFFLLRGIVPACRHKHNDRLEVVRKKRKQQMSHQTLTAKECHGQQNTCRAAVLRKQVHILAMYGNRRQSALVQARPDLSRYLATISHAAHTLEKQVTQH